MMPKEKAIQLWNKIFITKMSTNNFRYEETKLCTLILVNEIIKECGDRFLFIKYDYWKKVKQEIEKL